MIGNATYRAAHLTRQAARYAAAGPSARLLVDRAAYIKHLEAELQRVSAACLAVHALGERLEGGEARAQSLEAKVRPACAKCA